MKKHFLVIGLVFLLLFSTIIQISIGKNLKMQNIKDNTTFSMAPASDINIYVENMPDSVCILQGYPHCCWINCSTMITIKIYGDSEEEYMNASIFINGCGLDISIDEEDAIEKGYWIDVGIYEIEISSPKTAGTVTIRCANDTENISGSIDFIISGLYGSVITSFGNDKEIFVNLSETIIFTVTNGQYAEVHVTYFDEDWNFISCLNLTFGDNTAGNGLNGIFEFDITKDDIDEGIGYIVVAASAGAHYMYDVIDVVLPHPNKPQTPTGKKNGKIGQPYSYTTKTIDPEGGQVYYMWDWGDGNISQWLGPYDSGIIISTEYTWDSKGMYQIKVKAKNIYNRESKWSDTLNVNITKSKNKAINTPFLQFFCNFLPSNPNLFPILQKFLQIFELQ